MGMLLLEAEPLTSFLLKTNVQHALDQANLLSGVRNDIECALRFSLVNFSLNPGVAVHTSPLLQTHSWPSETTLTVRIV